ncbi:hypothetical protein [Novosphingobium olei]|uniref:Uncharacterized protein n=1 Tax=Novosphingobium olei TaxID=2728851 RepID=A0A7Y0G8Z8_9SPHN|nr:hypothetical protein [Novosphingobium olei]NML93636.1 hypothetical protein [Novosphingobium olei]
MGSRLSRSAQRLRSAAIGLNSSEDVALVNRFADELEALSMREDTLKRIGIAAEASGTSETLKACLTSVFSLPEDDSLDWLIDKLDDNAADTKAANGSRH